MHMVKHSHSDVFAGKGDVLLNAVSLNLSRRYCSSFGMFSSSGG